jgi:DNA-binding LacI/PurR family transcriptional regulator
LHSTAARTGSAGERSLRPACSLVTRRAGNIALVVSGSDGATGSGFSASVFADPFFGRVAAGVVNFPRPLGIHPVLMLRPQLTTVRQPIEDMAGEMARLLLSRIEEPDHEPASVIFDPTLVVRASA